MQAVLSCDKTCHIRMIPRDREFLNKQTCITTSYKLTTSISMPDQVTTLEHFIASSLKPIKSARPYLLDKPCTRCHQSTNTRVNLPTYSHRICSTCLVKLERSHGSPGPVFCPTCSTYWFTLHPRGLKGNGSFLTNTESDPKIEKRSERNGIQILGDALSEEIMSISHIGNVSQVESVISSEQASHTLRSAASPSMDTLDLYPIGSQSEGCSEELDVRILRVKEQWKIFCLGKDAAMREEDQQRTEGYEDEGIQEGHVFELEATESRTIKTSSQNQGLPPIIANEIVTAASQDQQQASTATLADDQYINPTQSLAILIIMVYMVFEIVSTLFWASASVLSMRG
jgi:hypothetical protein